MTRKALVFLVLVAFAAGSLIVAAFYEIDKANQSVDERDKVYEIVLEVESVRGNSERALVQFNVLESDEKVGGSGSGIWLNNHPDDVTKDGSTYHTKWKIVVFFRDATYFVYNSEKGQTPDDAKNSVAYGTTFFVPDEQAPKISELEAGDTIILKYRKAETPKYVPQIPEEPVFDLAKGEEVDNGEGLPKGRKIGNPKWDKVIDWRATWSRVDKKVIFP